MAWTDDYYTGSSDYPTTYGDAPYDLQTDDAYERTEDVGE